MTKVSIIVTAYNIEKYIDECLSGLIAQTLEDIEIIVVDDGSSDSTPQIIKDFALRDSRIIPILFENNTIGGVASAANAGMDVATGDFIGFADGDDRYAPDMFEKLWQAAITTDSDLAMCRYMLLDQSEGTLKEPAESDRWLHYPRQVALDLSPSINKEVLRFISVPWRKIYRRDLVEKAELRYPVGDFFFEDNPFHWMSVISANRIVLLPERLCEHRVARAGQTMSTVDERLLRIFQHHDIIRDWLIQTGHMHEYRAELLWWVAAQLSWVSQRAEGEIKHKLFNLLTPVIAQYESRDLEEFGRINGRGRTVQMLEALRAADYAQFTKAAGWSGATPAKSRAPANISLFRRGLYHLKHTGVRETMVMTRIYLSERLGRSRRQSASAPQKVNESQNRLSNQDLMLALVVLQREIRSLRQEVKEMSKRQGTDS